MLNYFMRTLAVALVFLVVSAPIPAQQATKKTLSAGAITKSVYRNPDLGFTYKIILGWVDRTEQNRPEAEADNPSNGQVLLAVFEHPPEVKGEEVNSAVVIAAEQLSSFPGVKTAADYFGPLSEATTAQGFKVVNEPYQTTVGSKSLVRSDFSKESGKVTIYQSSLVMLSKGYAVSFTFIGGSEDEVEQLISSLTFSTASHEEIKSNPKVTHPFRLFLRDDSQPIPEQLKLPNAPETARSVQCFESFASTSTMLDVVRKCGIPDEHHGNGIYIFVYNMADGSAVTIGTADLEKLMGITHVQTNGVTKSLFLGVPFKP